MSWRIVSQHANFSTDPIDGMTAVQSRSDMSHSQRPLQHALQQAVEKIVLSYEPCKGGPAGQLACWPASASCPSIARLHKSARQVTIAN